MTLAVETRGRTLATGRVRTLGFIPLAAVGIDLLVVLTAGVVAVIGHNSIGLADADQSVSTTLTIAGPTIVALWMVALVMLGSHKPDVLGAGHDEYRRVVRATALTAAAVGIASYLTKFDLSRGFFLLMFLVGLPSLLLGRATLRSALHRARSRGHLVQRVVVSGTSGHVDELCDVLARESWLGYDVVGTLTDDGHDLTPGGRAVVGHTSSIRGVVDDLSADVVLFADNALGSSDRLRELIWDLEAHDVQVVVAPSVADISADRVRVRPVGGLPLIHIDKPSAHRASHWAKRTFDVVGSLALLVLFAPVFAMAAIRIWAHDRGPVLFAHGRVGRDGETFRCLKFRTMVTDADDLLADLQAENGADALCFKLEDDPRITRPGRLLRRTSLDELPQLVNVLRGDMSLVGPRPQVDREVALYRNGMQRRLMVRPGMTGLWQVSGRSDLSADEARRLDLFYVDNWSMLQDLHILLRTFGAVLGRRGAY